MARGRVLRPPGTEIAAGREKLRGRPRGRDGVRREARAGLEGALSATPALPPPPRRGLIPLAPRRGHHGARAAAVSVLAQVDALPGPERQPAVARSGNISDGPSSAALTWAGMSSSPSSVCVQYDARSGTASSNQVSKSRRTSGEAFSFSASDAEVCWISRCSIPTRSSPSSGSASSTSRVTR